MTNSSLFRISFCFAVSAFVATFMSGCFLLTPKEEPDPKLALTARTKPLSPEESQELLGEVGDNFIYGQGVGEAALNVGAVAAFPPYAIVVIGNTALSLSGYEKIGVSTALPEEERSWWSDAYDGVLSGPGRLVAAIAGEEYRTKEVAKQRLAPFISEPEKGKGESGTEQTVAVESGTLETNPVVLDSAQKSQDQEFEGGR